MKDLIENYARVIVRSGVNLQKGEVVCINAQAASRDLVLAVTREAYLEGAERVVVHWYDDEVKKLDLQLGEGRGSLDPLGFEVDFYHYMVDHNACYVNMLSGDPELFADVDGDLLTRASRVRNKTYEFYYDAVDANSVKWCIVGVPDEPWAKKVFPDLEADEALAKLWQYVAHTMRLDCADAVAAWEEHNLRLHRRSDVLNGLDLAKLHYTNALGTDLWLELPEGYIFEGGCEMASTGVPFNPNMPTEEIFSAPYKYGVNGKVVASMPLFHNGVKVEDFGFVFDKGRIVDYWAKEGLEVLKGIVETDEGSRYLGEVALVPYDSPISNLRTLFLETLFDENASCHLAIGAAYPSCVKGGLDMTKEQLEEHGINSSLEHVDFMIGTKDLRIDGITRKGEVVGIFVNGNFVF